MKTIALDVWQDLREKKLAPVAILLVAALIAIPAVMAKSPAEAPPPPAPATPGAAQVPEAETPQLKPVAQLEDSNLDTYSAKNPFAPLPQLKQPDELAASGAAVDPPAGVAAAGGGVAAGGGGGVPTFPTSGTGGGGGSPVPRFMNPGSTPDAQLTLFTYVADVDFGPPGNERRRNGIARLQILPNGEKPLLVFLGVAPDNKTAVFLADSTASQSGEGRCEPDVDTCTFVYLTTAEKRNEHVFTDEDGQDYLLRVRDIRRVKVEDLEEREAKKKRQAKKSGAEQPKGLARVFSSLIFVDEEQ